MRMARRSFNEFSFWKSLLSGILFGSFSSITLVSATHALTVYLIELILLINYNDIESIVSKGQTQNVSYMRSGCILSWFGSRGLYLVLSL